MIIVKGKIDLPVTTDMIGVHSDIFGDTFLRTQVLDMVIVLGHLVSTDIPYKQRDITGMIIIVCVVLVLQQKGYCHIIV